jgi:hypothetical protein
MAGSQLVFIHGRGQEFKDPLALRRDWFAGLNAGLTRAGLAVLADENVIRFPFYANELYRLTAELPASGIHLEALPDDPDAAGPLHPGTTQEVGDVERQLIADMAVAAGVPTVRLEGFGDFILGWGPARKALQLLAKKTRVDQAIIAAYLKDVAVYLTHARDAVLKIVEADIPKDVPLVLVTHSLGTVVARDLLDDLNVSDRTKLWVCAGSPLGIEAVQKNLKTPGTVNPGVSWVSAYDVNDIVALGHPLEPSWHQPLTDVEVENGEEPHSITQYLAHPEVARTIGEALTSN